MGNIFFLEENTINKIAAGEIIERPASIVKELVENSIDAKATSIIVKTEDAGKTSISVMDNGHGIMADDLENAFQRHATSKINTIDDLVRVRTLGFRGEAMPSIAAISEIELRTCSTQEETGSYIYIKGGEIVKKEKIGFPVGTDIRVSNLFYNTPARFKFLKSNRTENAYITDIMEKIALSNTSVSLKYIVNDKVMFHTPGNGDLLSVIQCLYGIKTVKMMLPIEYSNELVEIEGYISKPELTKGNSTYIIISINNRVINNIALKEAVRTAYRALLMKRRYPFTILNIKINPNEIDVNVHPTKAEIKFKDSRSIFNIIYYVINNTLLKSDLQYTKGLSGNVLSPLEKGEDYRQIQPSSSFFSTLPKQTMASNYTRQGKVEDFLYESTKIQNENLSIKEEHDDSKCKIIIGQLFNTYILCQDGERFYLVDQHAAHERVIYDYLLYKKVNNTIEQQALLTPLIIELTPKEKENIEVSMETFNSFGFDIEMFSDNSIAIRQVPIIMGEPCSGSVITNLLDTAEEFKNNLEALEKNALIQIACKNAIKANHVLSIAEMTELIKELYKTDMYYTCPHGRPTIISMDKYDLEKRFKRII